MRYSSHPTDRELLFPSAIQERIKNNMERKERTTRHSVLLLCTVPNPDRLEVFDFCFSGYELKATWEKRYAEREKPCEEDEVTLIAYVSFSEEGRLFFSRDTFIEGNKKVTVNITLMEAGEK